MHLRTFSRPTKPSKVRGRYFSVSGSGSQSGLHGTLRGISNRLAAIGHRHFRALCIPFVGLCLRCLASWPRHSATTYRISLPIKQRPTLRCNSQSAFSASLVHGQAPYCDTCRPVSLCNQTLDSTTLYFGSDGAGGNNAGWLAGSMDTRFSGLT